MTPYLRFILVAHNLEQTFSKQHDLDRKGLKLLEMISIHEALNQPLMTTEAIKLSEIGSSASIYQSLTRLKAKGLVTVVPHGVDRRVKYLSVTDVVRQYQSRLGSLLLASAENASKK